VFVRGHRAGVVLVVALAAGAVGCGSSSSNDGKVPSGTTLTIYSSLPFSGPEREQALDVRDAEQIALRQHSDRVGKFTIRYISLDDASASKDVGILQVSPASTAVGLTQGGVGADKGEPDKYYPTAMRTFARVMPADTAQGAVQAAYMTAEGCTEVYILHDSELYDGDGLAEVVARDAATAGVQVLGNDVVPVPGQAATKQAQEVRTSRADCVFFGVVAADRAGPTINAIHAAVPTAKLFVPSEMATAAFTSRLARSAQPLTFITSPTLPTRLAPALARRFVATFTRAEHHAPATDAVFGYEAMQALLQAIQNAGPKADEHQSVINAFFGLRNRDSALGTYSITRRGDTTMKQFAGYRVRNGLPVFDQMLTRAPHRGRRRRTRSRDRVPARARRAGPRSRSRPSRRTAGGSQSRGSARSPGGGARGPAPWRSPGW
jgi:branched-chain amino acid transport system substrate-binding protein